MRGVIRATENLPCTAGAAMARQNEIQSMVDQIEAETMTPGCWAEPAGGQIPAAFITITSAINKWSQLNVWIRRYHGQEEKPAAEDAATRQKRFFNEAAENPYIVAFYVAVKLELLLLLIQEVYDVHADGSRKFVDYYGVPEWGEGGIPHMHIIQWMKGNPRCDKLLSNDASRDGAGDRVAKGALTQEQLADQTASYFDKLYTEHHIPFGNDPSAEIFEQVGAKRRAKQSNEEYICPLAIDGEAYKGMLQGDFAGRLGFLGRTAEAVNFHDFHDPEPMGLPAPYQACAKCKAETQGTDSECWFCAKKFPKDRVPSGCEYVAEDEDKSGVIRWHASRNSTFVNKTTPLGFSWGRWRIVISRRLSPRGLRIGEPIVTN